MIARLYLGMVSVCAPFPIHKILEAYKLHRSRKLPCVELQKGINVDVIPLILISSYSSLQNLILFNPLIDLVEIS